VIPPVFMRLPARMKKGMARSVKLVVPAYIRCGTMLRRAVFPRVRKLRMAVRPMLTAMGSPRSMRTTSVPKTASVPMPLPLRPVASYFFRAASMNSRNLFTFSSPAYLAIRS